ncbi:MAG: Flagellar basal-body rod protein FlgF [Gammaproteobacteria bacterium]|nr:Flagellar basal-body rod protein FlgF [Gammaproteobacteria bacterium]
MDRMVYLAMTGARQMLMQQAAASNNLANAASPGFRADLEAFRAMPVFGPGQPSRVYAMAERPAVNFQPGSLETTGNDLDVAVDGEGFLAVQAADGTEAYTRAGDLRLNGNGMLETGIGRPVLGNGGPVAIPPADAVVIAADGTISIRPVGQGSEALVVVDRLKLVRPDTRELYKGEDGLFRQKNRANLEADAAVRVVQGALESSNVNSVSEMINMMTYQRNFELQVKAMQTAEKNDAAMSQLMRMA